MKQKSPYLLCLSRAIPPSLPLTFSHSKNEEQRQAGALPTGVFARGRGAVRAPRGMGGEGESGARAPAPPTCRFTRRPIPGGLGMGRRAPPVAPEKRADHLLPLSPSPCTHTPVCRYLEKSLQRIK